MLEAMTADGTVQRIGGTSGQRPKFALIPSVQPQTPAATDGEPGDGTPAPEPDDTQAEDRRRAVLEALREAPEANADSIASATGLSVSEARFFLHAMAADGIVERIEHENAGAIRRNPTIWRIVDADQPGDTQVVDAAEAARAGPFRQSRRSRQLRATTRCRPPRPARMAGFRGMAATARCRWGLGVRSGSGTRT